MNGKVILFPTPYPDETLYSVICRYDLLTGRNSFRGTSEELFGRRNNLNAEIPQCIGSLVKGIPAKTGLSTEYFYLERLELKAWAYTKLPFRFLRFC